MIDDLLAEAKEMNEDFRRQADPPRGAATAKAAEDQAVPTHQAGLDFGQFLVTASKRPRRCPGMPEVFWT